MLRGLLEGGAAQIYEEETGKPSIQNGKHTPDAQAFIDNMLRPINFNDRSGWHQTATLERTLMDALTRRMKSLEKDRTDKP